MIRRYLQWLDGEYLRVTDLLGEFQDVNALVEDSLKLQAILGYSVSLNDVQLIDSPVLTPLFGRPDFRSYLNMDRDFLQLIADPGKNPSAERYGVAMSGARRVDEYWSSSSLTDPVPIRGLIALMKKREDSWFNVQSELMDRHSESIGPFLDGIKDQYVKRHLLGILWGVAFFADPKHESIYAPASYDPGNNYYAVLTRIASDSGSLSKADAELVKRAVTFIEHEIASPLRAKSASEDEIQDLCRRRTTLRDVLEAVNKHRLYANWECGHHAIWHTAIKAWHQATYNTLNTAPEDRAPHGMSDGYLRGAARLSEAEEQAFETLLLPGSDFKKQIDKYILNQVYPSGVNWSLRNLTWGEIQRAVGENWQTRETYIKFVEQGKGYEANEAFGVYAKGVDRSLGPKGTAGSTLNLVFVCGASLMIALGTLDFTTAVIGAIKGRVVTGALLKEAQRYLFRATLRRGRAGWTPLSGIESESEKP